MTRSTGTVTPRGAAVTLGLALVLLGGTSCRNDESAGPSDPGLAGEAGPGLATTAAALPFRQVTVNFFHSCGVTTDDRAYCWGDNAWGQLGDGTTAGHRRPVSVAGGFHFRQISAGSNHTCAVTPGDRAYCWGSNNVGQLGDGTTTDRLTPVAVAGGLRFRRLSAGTSSYTCGVTLEDKAYCWGGNFKGQLGDGTTTDRSAPVAVAGGRRFGQVSAGGLHTCGVTPGSLLFCWGDNSAGELGDGTIARRLTPVRVHAGELLFRQASAGYLYTCAVTLDDRAYCWGQNGDGRLGNGTFNQGSLTPGKVRGGIHFRSVTTGLSHACGITPEDRAYCWGDYFFLGAGATTDQRSPVPVSGGLLFRQLQAQVQHTCGVTTDYRAYCWGLNADGQIGDGTTTFRSLPVAVAGPI